MEKKVTSYRLPVYVFDYLEEIMADLNKHLDRNNTFPIKNFTRADVLEMLIRKEHIERFPERYES